MSGHSKWATIKRAKGLTDAKRGVVFTRLGNMIALAARGGTDPSLNSTLALAIEKAKAANMPNSNIERAVQRVRDKSEAEYEEVTYEGYGPGGVAILVECATNNRNRTYPEVRSTFTKLGGSVAETGSVAFQFERRGVIRVDGSDDDTMMKAIEAGAEDISTSDGELIVYTEPKQLYAVKSALELSGLKVKEAQLSHVPKTSVIVADEVTQGKVVRLLEALEDLDDVVETFSNFDVI